MLGQFPIRKAPAMPIINRQDAQEIDYVGQFFAAPSAGRAQALRRLFMEKLDFASATGAVSLANAPKNVALPPQAERIASMEALQVVYVPLDGNGPDRVRKAEAAAAKLITDALHGDLLLVMTNPSSSQLHGYQVQESPCHGDVGDVCRPYLVRPRYLHAT